MIKLRDRYLAVIRTFLRTENEMVSGTILPAVKISPQEMIRNFYYIDVITFWEEV